MKSFSGKRRVIQLVAALVYGDAVSDDCLAIQRALRGWGIETHLYATRVEPRLRREARELHHYRHQADDLIILHYSLWSDAAAAVLELPAPRLVIIYHNVTPPEYFEGVNPLAEAVTRRGRTELGRFVDHTLLALGDSDYNRQELAAAGFGPTGVLPIVVDLPRLDGPSSPRLARELDDGRTNFLSVGRVAPNKRLEDAIRSYYHYHQHINPQSRLLLVGSPSIAPAYQQWLERLVLYLGLQEHVRFAGHVSQADLVTYYRSSHVYLCVSDHEGFCVPLVEAMYLGVPIIGYAATAVPETLGEAGILVHRKDPAVLAELMHLVADDATVRQRLVALGQARAASFARPKVEALLADHLKSVLAAV